jgi:ubiquinone/menaquinone biosynthesis C-methylase UbiE
MAQKFKVTYATLSADNEELQSAYDEAIARVKARWLGREVPMFIGGKRVFADEKFDKYSPINTDVHLCTAQKGMVEHARTKVAQQGLDDRVKFVTGDACHMPFEDESFDVVLAECTTTLLDREKAFGEFLRVAKRGGCVGDLEMTWTQPPPKELADKLRADWDGFETMTIAQWKAFYERIGLVDVKAVDFSESMVEAEKALKKELGLAGQMKLALKLLANPVLRRAMGEYRELAKRYRNYMGYGYIVGRKP